MASNDCKASGERPQNIFADRVLHARQLSVISSPYGVIKATSCSSHNWPVCAMPEPGRGAPRELRASMSRFDPHRRVPTITALVAGQFRHSVINVRYERPEATCGISEVLTPDYLLAEHWASLPTRA